MRVKITYIHDDGISTEVVDKLETVEIDALLIPGKVLYEDDFGLFYVDSSNLLEEVKV